MTQPLDKRIVTEKTARETYATLSEVGDIRRGVRLREDYDKAILVGSSTMQGMASRFVNEFATRGITTTHSKTAIGSWVVSTMGMAVGTRPLVAKDFTIPASGPVTIEPINMLENNHGSVNIPGSFLGVSGTLVSPTGSNVWTFTRDSAGGARNVPSGTSFIPSEPEGYLNGLAVLNIGKNTLTTTRTGWDAQRVIDMTESMIARFGGADGRVLVVGQFNNGGTPEVSTTRTKIAKYNDYFREKLGDRFFDLGAYVTGSQIWADTGLTPTTEDQAEQAAGNLPPSVRNDSGHLNTAGYTAAVNAIIARLDLLGWIPPRPPISWSIAAHDSLNDVDGSMVGTYTESGTLQYKAVPGSNVTRVLGNKIAATGSTTRIGIDPGSADQMIEATLGGIVSDPGQMGARLLVRAAGTSTYYFASPRKDAASTGLSIWRNVGGALASLASSDTVPKDGDRLGLSVEGSTLRLWLNGVPILEAQDGQRTSGMVGFELSGNTTVTFDDVTVKVPNGVTATPGDGVVTSDSFAGVDATSLERTTDAALGGVSIPWVPDSAPRWAITGNALTRGALADGTGVLNMGDLSVTDAEVTLKVKALPASGATFYIDARRHPSNSEGLRVSLNPSGNIRLVHRGAQSVMTNLGSGGYVAAGDTCGIRCVGDQVSLLKNGAVVETVTFGTVMSGPRWGVAYSVSGGAGVSVGEYQDFVLRELF